MNIERAKILLSLDETADMEEIEEAMEEKLFHLKKEVLNLLPVPSLVKRKQMTTERWSEIESPESNAAVYNPPVDTMLNAPDAISFLEQYEAMMSEVKLKLANSNSFQSLHKVLDAAVLVQSAYMRVFPHFFSDYQKALPEETKSREIIDTGRLLTALKSGQVTSDIAWEIEKELARISKLSPVV